MTKLHPHEGATYRILEQPDATFCVEVTIPGAEPTKIVGLSDRAAAETWVAKHQERIAGGAVQRPTFRNRRRR